ncbi:MAG: DNA primase [Endozoicomonas sp.]
MAGRIPQYFIDDLLSRIDIVDIVDSRVKLKKTGRNYSACCPFHNEKTPSFTVSPDKQFYYCFGCGASGNALGFVMDHDHLEFPEAVDSLAGQLGLDIPREESSRQQRGPGHSELFNLLSQAVQFYTDQLQQHSQSTRATQYLKQRGLDRKTCQAFGIGFAPPGWDNLKSALATSVEREKQLIETGMLVENEDRNRVYDRFRDRIIFPIRDSRGHYIAFGGRVLGDEKPKYLNSPESPIFYKGKELYGLYEARQANRKLDRILVVEGYMDVVALTQQGITNSVATLGTATTSDHMQKLFKLVPEVVFCFDGDDAGRRAAWRALESTLPNMEDGRQARFLFLPQGEDPDSMVRSEGSAEFQERIRSQALSLDNLLFRELKEGLDLGTMDGRARLAKLAQPYLKKLPEGLFHQLMLKKLSDLTGLDQQYLEAHFEESTPPPSRPSSQNAAPRQLSAPHPHLESTPAYPPMPDAAFSPESYYQPDLGQDQTAHQGRSHFSGQRFSAASKQPFRQSSRQSARLASAGYAIRQLLCNPEFAREVTDPLESLTLANDSDSLLLIELLKTLQQTPGLSPGALIAQWYGTDKGMRLQALAEMDHGTTEHRQEFLDTLDNIRRKANEAWENNRLKLITQNMKNKKPEQLEQDTLAEYRKYFQQLQQRHAVRDSEKK